MIPFLQQALRAGYYGTMGNTRSRIRRSPSVWAQTERRLAAGQSPLTDGDDIHYRHDVMPHCVAPMDDADDPEVNVIVLWMGRRLGKTEGICGNVIGRTVTDDPSNIYSMWPVEDSSDRFSRDVIEPMIEATPALRTVFVEKKSRESGRTIDYKRFAGGSLYIVNAGSKSKSRGMAAKVVLCHEIDAYPVSVQGEGDPIEKALGRAEGFSAVKILESTGTHAAEIGADGKKIYHSNIERWYDRSDQRKWFCPCRKCGHGQWLKWEQIREMPKKSGEIWFYLCEACDLDHNEKQWRRMVQAGQWKPTAPFVDGIRGYWINGFNSLLPKGRGFRTKLHQFAAEGHRALKASPEERRVWINEVKTELVSLDDEKTPPPAYQPIIDNREDYATDEAVTIPARGLVLTTMTDVHGDRLEVNWQAWARNEESWNCGHFVLFGDTNRTEVWEEWTKHLQRSFPHESGGSLRLSLALVDGGWRVDPILATLQRLQRVNVPGVSGKIIITKGVPEWQGVIHKTWATIKDRAKGIHIGTWGAKSLIYERLKWHSAAEKPSAGFIHFGKCYSEEFIRQAVSESPVFKIVKGVNVETFRNPEGNRNEALDLLVGGLAAFRRRKWDFDTIERELAASAPQAKPAPKPESQPVTTGRNPFRGRGWRV